MLKIQIALKFIYSEKATKFCEIVPLLLTVCTVVKIKGKISQNFVAFSEYMNFTYLLVESKNFRMIGNFVFTEIGQKYSKFSLLCKRPETTFYQFC